MTERPTYVVIGGGVAGLAAARVLAGSPPVSLDESRSFEPARVVLLEASGRLGGKVATGELLGAPVELGPDQFLRRAKSAESLVMALGLGDDLVAPAKTSAGVYAKGKLRQLPTGLLLGIPTDLEALAKSGIVSSEGVARARMDQQLDGPPFEPGELGLGENGSMERSAGEILRRRLGDEVVDYLVDPLLGGINAGRVDHLSLAVTAPAVAEALCGKREVLGPLRASLPASPPAGAVFYGVRGGLSRIVSALAIELAATGVETRLSSPVEAIWKTETGYLVKTGGDSVACDGVVLALPAPAAADLLGALSPGAATALGSVAYADVALVSFGYPAGLIDCPEAWSGFLVPAREGYLMSAATFVSRKWPEHSRPGVEIVRVSAGRYLDTRPAELSDDELAERLAGELIEITGVSTEPIEHLVTRWPGSFPQYRPGHRAAMLRALSFLEELPGLALAGAALGGIGLPACISSGEQAALGVLSPSRRL
jgi:oxygen-dependent protoporphyrinogen oxidase